ncbi:MAG: M28 family metallopeptidase [Promethearchaeota archaeon]
MDKKLEDDMREFILETCERIGPRPPCSNKEAEGSEFFQEKLRDYCDETNIEKFYTHPGAYKASFRIPMIVYFLTLVFYWHIPWLSLAIISLSFLILIGEMSLAKEIIDFIFPKKSSQNVISKIKPINQIKTLIIIGSHVDSNWEFPLVRKLRNKFAGVIAMNIFLNGILLLILIIKNILILFQFEEIIYSIEIIIFWVFIWTIPVPLMQLFFLISNRPVMGANDNLSGMATCFELAKSLYLPENRPNNVEVWINAYGCEEIGSKGSKAFVKKHLNEIKNAKIINIDMIGNKNGSLLIGKSEIQGLVKMNEDMIDLIKKSADNLNIRIKISALMAFTDSLSFCRKDLSATSICSVPRSAKNYFYHTREDVTENMSFENLINTYKICMDVITRLDNK